MAADLKPAPKRGRPPGRSISPLRTNTVHHTLGLTDREHDDLVRVASHLGLNKTEVLRRLISAASSVDYDANQRLCICNGERRVAVVAGL